MPSRDEHLAKARANEQLALSLRDNYPDWALTILFYSALHWVDAVLDGLGGAATHPGGHGERHGIVARRPELRSIERQYRTLRTVSENARYNCELFYPGDVTFVWQTRFQPVEAACRRLLGLA